MSGEKIKILLDTDIGDDIDDAVALAYLLAQPRCELLGITTVCGEASKRAEMISAICRNIGRDDIPIHCGAENALEMPTPQQTCPQATALGDWDRRTDFPPDTAVEFMRQTIHANPGEITLLTIGPMTNIARLFQAEPGIVGEIKQIVSMAGQFAPAGAEWNVRCDPAAGKIVYDSRPGGGHLSIGIDITMKCELSRDECRRRFNADVMSPVRDFAELWFIEMPSIVFHDPLAAACIFAPDICEYRTGLVTATGGTAVNLQHPGPSTGSSEQSAWTEFTEDLAGPHVIASSVDVDRFFEHYFDVVK